ncbi:unnamed protein product [Orchesella dallaii]|uniref:LysM domain-containing protein n=1 Tax=Orchesella dallaii TaxID=48710 RepID=A0ABP1R4V9_9HEXA
MFPENEQKKLFLYNPNASEFVPSVAPKCTCGQGSRSHILNPEAQEFISAKFNSYSELRILNPNASVFVPQSFVVSGDTSEYYPPLFTDDSQCELYQTCFYCSQSTHPPQTRASMVPFSPIYVLIGVKPRRRAEPALLNPTSQ